METRTREVAEGGRSVSLGPAGSAIDITPGAAKGHESSTSGMLGPATAPTRGSGIILGFGVLPDAKTPGTVTCADRGELAGGERRGRKADRVAAQACASGRLANPCQASVLRAASQNAFECLDGKTRLPYRVCGEPVTTAGAATSCNFVVVHDFFDNVDKTEVLFRPVTSRHRGCRVLAFSYPGQAGTVFRVPPSMRGFASGVDIGSSVGKLEGVDSLRSGGGGGGKPCTGVPNNAFIATKLHELLQHVHSVGEMSLSAPFHLVRTSTQEVYRIAI